MENKISVPEAIKLTPHELREKIIKHLNERNAKLKLELERLQAELQEYYDDEVHNDDDEVNDTDYK